MADFSSIIQEVNADINTNGANEITGAKLNKVLRDMITAVNAAKQDPLTIDATPTEGSTDPVQSGGVYDALENKPTIYYTQDIAAIPPTILAILKVGDFVKYGDGFEATAVVSAIEDGHTYLFASNGVFVEGWIYGAGDIVYYYSFDLRDFPIRPADPIANHLAGLDSEGNLTDSGIAANEVATKADIAYLQQQIDELKNQS